ncbi:mitogen-activated protein kinase kinase kinase [Malassezia obtusa]|uniref:Mitogen-activated protein kinase kinase kinase n=1 Tax=Malassezia obtusa TaxID=76774 RepID=A0AAF0IUF2_9BASI|nr:mitogen-activated protein kinase kinase kinase [Malassezia obtusa]
MPGNVRLWSVSEVLAWLHECHLGQHASVFAENDIQGTALLELDQAALKEMGLTSMGERLRILAAIRALHKRSQEIAVQRPIPARSQAQFGIAGHHARAKPGGEWLVAPPESDVVRHPSPTPSSHTPSLAAQPISSASTYSPSLYASSIARNESDADLSASVRGASPIGRVGNSVPASRRPNTATGISTGPWPSASAVTSPTSPTSAIPQRSRRPATATSGSQNMGYSVGRGAFGPSAASKPRMMQISAPYNLRRADSESDSESVRGTEAVVSPAFKNIRRALIKFFASDGTSRVVDVSECHYAHEVLSRVLRKFGLPKLGADLDTIEYMNPYAFAMAGTDQKLKILSESELMAVCSMPQAYTPVWQYGLYLIENGTPLPDITQQPQWVATRRASTQSILLGLGVENLPAEPSPSPSRASFARRAARPAVAVAVAATEPLRPTTKVKRRVRNFFGQRPPSELISSHLADYFPATDSRELQRHSRASLIDAAAAATAAQSGSTSPISPTVADGGRALPPMRRFPAELANSDSPATSPRDATDASAASVDDEAASLVTMDEITQDLDERNAHEPEASANNVIVDQDGVPIPLRSPRARKPSTASLVYATSPPKGTAPAARTPPAAPGAASDTAAPGAGAGASGASGATNELEASAHGFATKPRMRWHKGALIGAGSFGKVFLGMNAKTGLLMAVKQVELPTSDDTNTQRRKYMIESLESEIALLKTIEHPNIVHYLDSYADNEYLNIFLEYVPGGSVVALLRNYGAFEEQLVQNFVRQILQGLLFLHSQAIVHRDIKGANILVDNKGGVKISDFGISKKVESGLLVKGRGQRGMLQGSVFWMAPEVVKQTSYTPKADIWSVGCLIVEMLTALHPWPKLDQMQALFQIGMSRHPEIPPDISAAATDFLNRAFEVHEENRPSAAAMLDHVFITQTLPDSLANP